MARIVIGPRVAKALRSRDEIYVVAVEQALERFVENERHPGLHFEKLSGTPDVFTIRINRGDRIFLRRRTDAVGTIYDVMDIGSHVSICTGDINWRETPDIGSSSPASGSAPAENTALIAIPPLPIRRNPPPAILQFVPMHRNLDPNDGGPLHPKLPNVQIEPVRSQAVPRIQQILPERIRHEPANPLAVGKQLQRHRIGHTGQAAPSV